MKEEILKKLMEYLQNTEVFLSAQIPDVLQQILQIELFKLWCLFVLGIICLVVFGLCLFLIITDYYYEEWKTIAVVIGLLVGGVYGFVCTPFSIYKLYLFYYAPKVFLIEYIKTIL